MIRMPINSVLAPCPTTGSRETRATSRRFIAAFAFLLAFAPSAYAQTTAAAPPAVAGSGGDSVALAKKLSNPISDLISLPFQFNYNQGFATGNGDQYTLNIQPVIPFSISPDWNVISRTIVPIVGQDDVIPGKGSQFGLGATTQSFFFSPKAPTKAGLIWGVGPVFLIPTATDDIATNQWGAGITGVALRQKGPWTVGALANHVWSLTGDDEDGDISATFLQPFLSYTTPKATSFTLNTEFDLRLGNGTVVGADQRHDRTDRQDPRATRAVQPRRALLRRVGRLRPGWLGRPVSGDAAVSEIDQDVRTPLSARSVRRY